MRLRSRRLDPESGREEAAAQLADARRDLDSARREIAQMSNALDGLPLGVILVDAAGNVRVRNAAATRLGGAAHGDVLVRAAVDHHVAAALAGSESGSTVEL